MAATRTEKIVLTAETAVSRQRLGALTRVAQRARAANARCGRLSVGGSERTRARARARGFARVLI